MTEPSANPFMRRQAARGQITNSHKRAPKQEKEWQKSLKGAQLTPASGAREIKGDVRVPRLLRLEAKTTKNKSFSVTLDMVRKIEEAALMSGELPAMIVEFNDGFGKKLGEVAIVPSYVLSQLCEK